MTLRRGLAQSCVSNTDVKSVQPLSFPRTAIASLRTPHTREIGHQVRYVHSRYKGAKPSESKTRTSLLSCGTLTARPPASQSLIHVDHLRTQNSHCSSLPFKQLSHVTPNSPFDAVDSLLSSPRRFLGPTVRRSTSNVGLGSR